MPHPGNDRSSTSPTPQGVNRRTMVRGAAWTVPVIAVAVNAPAFAVSPIPCPSMPVGTTWNTTVPNGTLADSSTGNYGWTSNNRFNNYVDNGSTSQPVTIESTTTIPVVPGATYSISFGFFWGYGDGDQAASTQGTFSVLFNGVTQKSLTTRTPAVDANAGTVGVQPGSTTQSFTYVVPAGTTSLTVTYRWVMTPRTLASNDDIIVDNLTFNSCVK